MEEFGTDLCPAVRQFSLTIKYKMGCCSKQLYILKYLQNYQKSCQKTDQDQYRHFDGLAIYVKWKIKYLNGKLYSEATLSLHSCRFYLVTRFSSSSRDSILLTIKDDYSIYVIANVKLHPRRNFFFVHPSIILIVFRHMLGVVNCKIKTDFSL